MDLPENAYPYKTFDFIKSNIKAKLVTIFFIFTRCFIVNLLLLQKVFLKLKLIDFRHYVVFPFFFPIQKHSVT